MIKEFNESELSESERLYKYLNGEKVDIQPYSLFASDWAISSYIPNNIKDSDEEIYYWKKKRFGIEGIEVGLGLQSISEIVREYYSIAEDKMIIESYKDLSKLESFNPWSSRIINNNLEYFYNLRKNLPEAPISTSITGAITSSVYFRTTELILRDTRRNKEELKVLLSYINSINYAWIDVFFQEFGPGNCMISDPVSSNYLLSKKQYLEFSHPYINEITNYIFLKSDNKPSLHICGKTELIWDKISELNIFKFSLDNCESLNKASEFFKNRLLLTGNIDPVDVMLKGSTEDVDRAVFDSIVSAAASKKGYIIDIGCMVPWGTPLENFDAYLNAVNNYGRGAEIGKYPDGIQNYLENGEFIYGKC